MKLEYIRTGHEIFTPLENDCDFIKVLYNNDGLYICDKYIIDDNGNERRIGDDTYTKTEIENLMHTADGKNHKIHFVNPLFIDYDNKYIDFHNTDIRTKTLKADVILSVNPAIGHALEKIEPKISDNTNNFFAAYIVAFQPDDFPVELTPAGDEFADEYIQKFIDTEHGKYNYADYFNFVRENLWYYGQLIEIDVGEYYFDFDGDFIKAIPENDNPDCKETLTYTPHTFIDLIFELIEKGDNK